MAHSHYHGRGRAYGRSRDSYDRDIGGRAVVCAFDAMTHPSLKVALPIFAFIATFVLILVTSLFFAWRPRAIGGTATDLGNLAFGNGSDLQGLIQNGTLRPLYGGEQWVGNETCDASFVRRVDGRVGDVRCVDFNNGSTPINGSCIPSLLLLPSGKLVLIDNTCSTTGFPAGFACGGDPELIVTDIEVTADGRIANVICTSVNGTTLNDTAVGGDLTGFLPNPTLVIVFGSPGCFDFGIYELCVDGKGRITGITPTGNTFILDGTAVFSNTSTITGNYGDSLDLAPCGTAANYSFGDYIPYLNVDEYCRVTGAGNSTVQVITYTTDVISASITGTYPSIELGDIMGTAFAFGGNTSCFLSGIIGTDGRVYSPVCFSISGLGGGDGSIIIQGTANQIIVTELGNITTLSTPQDIGTGSTPTFASIILSGLTTNRIVIVNGGGALSTPFALTNGQLAIGVTGAAPAAGSITSLTLTVTLGAGTISIEAPQDIGTGASPSFTNINITSLSSNRIVLTTVGGQLATASALTDGQLLIGSLGTAPVAGAITSTTLTVSLGAGTIAINAPQAIGTGDSPSFTGVTVSGLTANRLVITSGANALSTPFALANGQLAIGSTGAAPVAANIPTTFAQILVTNGAGSITLGLASTIANTGGAALGTVDTIVNLCGTGGVSSTSLTRTGGTNAWTTPMGGGVIIFLVGLTQSSRSVARVTGVSSLVMTSAATIPDGSVCVLYHAGWMVTPDQAWSLPRTFVGTAQTGSAAFVAPGQLNVVGPSSSTTQFNVYINDQYSAYSMHAHTHDDNLFGFDAAYDGANWISSSTAGSFAIHKASGQLLLRYSQATAGNALPAWTSAMTLDTAGIVSFPLAAGIRLETSGGTPGILNYYEHFDGSATSPGASNPSNGDMTTNVAYDRIGRVVSISFKQSLLTAASFARPISFPAGTVPSRFRPINSFVSSFIRLFSGGVESSGTVNVEPDGTINIYKTLVSNFDAAGNYRWYEFTITFTRNP